MKSELEMFIDALVVSLNERYYLCQDSSAITSSILLAVLNSVDEARKAVQA